MSIVAEFTLRNDDFPFGIAFSTLPSSMLEIERLKTTGSGLSIYFWVNESASPLTESELNQCEIFDSAALIDTIGDEHFYRVDWNASREGVLAGIAGTGLTLQSGVSEKDSWSFRVNSESMETLSTFQRYCRDNEVYVRFTRFPISHQIFNGREFGVTDEQRDALVAAYVEGYFEEPRETTLDELAKLLGVTPQAVLARLRKGQRNILENTLVRSTDFNR